MLLTALLPIALLFHAHYTKGASLVTPPATCPHRGGVANTLPKYACTDDIDWMGDGYNNDDCRATIDRLFYVEVTRHKRQLFEFTLPGAVNQTEYPTMRTPRRYTVGKCTLAIVMLDYFPPGTLPGEDPPPHAQEHSATDVASFEDLWEAADMIETCCLQQYRIPGWAANGNQYSIGIFVWTAKSYRDRHVPPGVPTLVLELPETNFTAGGWGAVGGA